jgi:hypothetical protein
MSRQGPRLVTAAFLATSAVLLTAAPAVARGAAVRWGSCYPVEWTPPPPKPSNNPLRPVLPSEFYSPSPGENRAKPPIRPRPAVLRYAT